MRRIPLVIVMFSALCLGHPAGHGIANDNTKRDIDPGWLTDYEHALTKSRETGRPVLVQFTGSDWCGWCKKMDAEVFSTAQFRNWARKHVVLLEVDFPHRKHQTPLEKEKNRDLQERFKVTGYPTILFINDQKRELGRVVSYKPIDSFLDRAQAILTTPTQP